MNTKKNADDCDDPSYITGVLDKHRINAIPFHGMIRRFFTAAVPGPRVIAISDLDLEGDCNERCLKFGFEADDDTTNQDITVVEDDMPFRSKSKDFVHTEGFYSIQLVKGLVDRLRVDTLECWKALDANDKAVMVFRALRGSTEVFKADLSTQFPDKKIMAKGKKQSTTTARAALAPATYVCDNTYHISTVLQTHEISRTLFDEYVKKFFYPKSAPEGYKYTIPALKGDCNDVSVRFTFNESQKDNTDIKVVPGTFPPKAILGKRASSGDQSLQLLNGIVNWHEGVSIKCWKAMNNAGKSFVVFIAYDGASQIIYRGSLERQF